MAMVHQKRTVGCSVSDDTYLRVADAAAKRGITVSELVRHYVEEGLNNPTPGELRQLRERLSTTEGMLKELYEMAVVNWAPAKKGARKAPQVALPFLPAFEDWQKSLKKKGLANKRTGKTAYEELSERDDDELMNSAWDMTDEEVQEQIEEFYKANDLWDESLEKDKQARLSGKKEPRQVIRRPSRTAKARKRKK